jgi:hypothetical protein
MKAKRALSRLVEHINIELGDLLALLGVAGTLGYILGHILATRCWFFGP